VLWKLALLGMLEKHKEIRFCAEMQVSLLQDFVQT
jgi:hypothetical protein